MFANIYIDLCFLLCNCLFALSHLCGCSDGLLFPLPCVSLWFVCSAYPSRTWPKSCRVACPRGVGGAVLPVLSALSAVAPGGVAASHCSLWGPGVLAL